MECLKAAIAAGADAVYTGGALFGARAYAHNLTEEELLEAIDYVIGKIHRARVRIKSNVNFDATLELLIVEARREF